MKLGTSELHARMLLDPMVVEEPYAFYRRLLDEAPVWPVPGSDIVVVSSFAAVTEAVGRTAELSSNLVAVLHRHNDGTPGVHPFDAGMHTLATADPPVHSVHRGAVFPELMARRMAGLRADIDAVATDHIERALDGPRVEAMAAIANAVPIRVVSKLIGFTDEDPDALLAAAFESTGMLAATQPVEVLLGAMERTASVVEWITEQLQRAVDGGNADGILGVVAAAIETGELDFVEGVVIMTTLLAAGGESTTSLLGSAMHLLASAPGLQDRLRADPELVHTFIEEVLRLESPFRYHLRHATTDVELQGVTIPSGATVLLMWAAANRDPEEFDRPDEVVLDRPAPRHHMGFGRGIHLCVGAPLARLEAEVVLQRFLDRTSAFTLDPDDPPIRTSSLMVRRFDRLPLRVSAR